MSGRAAPLAGLLRRLDALARALLPAGLTLLLMLLAALPSGLPGLLPAVALPCLVFWSVFRPAALPPPVVFGLGLVQDLLTAAPPGTGVLVLLLAHGVAGRWRRLLARQRFLLVWLAFAGLAAGAAALGLGLQALLGWRLLPVAPAFWQALLAIGLYPGLAWLLTRLHEAMRRAEAMA
ncbi:rod shape-determining protein MreD [Roseicella frigidaeris]|uniref:rod shape-determining protein MreD n=1 Tax=Roseicella frigidaeris TaxID=2230885 RepID=UPI001FB32A46|nr:rod shape-determining protein MreD [Roseicella frigidaeris]